jgi:hypothetical protein
MMVLISHLMVAIEWVPYSQKECGYCRMTHHTYANYSTQIANLLEMHPLGRDAFIPFIKDKGEQCELKSLSLDKQPLFLLDKEKSVETKILKLP